MNTQYISIEQTDQTIINYIKNIMNPSIQDHSGIIKKVPIIYNGPQKWVQIRRRSYLADENNNALYPLISFSRTSAKMTQQPSINKAWAMKHRNFIQVDNKYSQKDPFNGLKNNFQKRPTYYKINIPIQLQCDYSFQIYTNTNWQMNQILQSFMIHNRIWWIIDGYRVKVTFSDFSNTTQVETTTQRLVKADFSLQTKSMIYPKDLGIQQKERSEKINITIKD